MSATGFDPARDVPLLERTPELLRVWLANLDEAWLEAREAPDAWTPREVVGHLVHGEETDWIPRARRLLEHGERLAFEPFDRTAQERRFADWSVLRLLERFARLRSENLAALRELPPSPENLARTGTHPALGRVTLDQLLCTWVVHDQAHVAQIARALARRHARDVGPWAAYIGLLTRP